MNIQPLFFAFGVTWFSAEPQPLDPWRAVYLRDLADGTYLATLLSPLYETHGIGICLSDDVEISGSRSLTALAERVAQVREIVGRQPNEWPVLIGYRSENIEDPDAAIVEPASRARLLEFLDGVGKIVAQAAEARGTVLFGGGM